MAPVTDVSWYYGAQAHQLEPNWQCMCPHWPISKTGSNGRQGTPYLEEQAITHFHDVGLVHSCYPLPIVQVCVAKRILCRSPRLLCCDDLQRLNNVRNDLML